MCETGDFFLFFLLALFYGVFFILAMSKVRYLVDFSRYWRHSLAFFIILIVHIGLRTVANILLCACAAEGFFFSFVLFSVPDVLFLSAFLLLIWQLVTVYFYAHLGSSLLDSMDRRPRLKCLAKAISTALICWLIVAAALYLCLIIGVLTSSALSRGVAVVNICFAAIAIATLLYLQIKFSGSPLVSIVWATNLHTITRVSVIWTLGRSISGILQLCDMLGLSLLTKEVSSDQTYTEIFQFTMWLVILIFSEVFCYFLVFDEEFMRIFIESESNDQLNAPLRSSIPVLKSNDLGIVSISSPVISTVLENKSKPKLHGLGSISQATFQGRQVAVRTIHFKRLTQYVYENMTSEAYQLKALQIEHLLPFLELKFEPPKVLIISAYAENSSLFRALHQDRVQFSYADKLRISQEIAMCFRDLHVQGFAHGHLTSHNVLLNHDHSVWVSDLGFNSLKKYASATIHYCNKSSWSSPEQLKDSGLVALKAKEPDDVYSFGMVLWELFTEQEPFAGLSRKQLKVVICQDEFRPVIPRSVDEGLTQLIKSCWNVDASSRPTFHLVYRSLCQM